METSGISPWLFVIALVVAVIVAVVCSRIAGRKGHSPVGFGVLGFFLPLIGLITVFVIKDRNKSIA